MNLKLHPTVEAAILQPERNLRINTNSLWKVTLGFIPAYVNYHKRVYDQHEMDCQQLEPARITTIATTTSKGEDPSCQEEKMDSIEMARAAASESVESQSSDQGQQDLSTPSLPAVEWSDLSESSSSSSSSSTTSARWGGWTSSYTNVDTDMDTSGVTYSGRSVSDCTSGITYSGRSGSDWAYSSSSDASSSGSDGEEEEEEDDSGSNVWRSAYSKWRKDPTSKKDLGWMEEFSRAVFGALSS